MTANKMPEMPELPEPVDAHARSAWGPKPDYYTEDQLTTYVEAYGRACYLAGLEAAKACVPARLNGEPEWVAGFNACRATTLANLTALEQEAKK